MKAPIPTDKMIAEDVPDRFDLDGFSGFALSFDPSRKCPNGLPDRIALTDFPDDNASVIALRLYIYEWQRIHNHSGALESADFDKIRKAYSSLKHKLPVG